MFKKIFLTILFALLFSIPLASIASDDTVYRNDEYHFRIKFPSGWEVKNGDGKHVVKKAVKDGSTVLVLVKNPYDSLSEKEKIELSENDKKELQTLEMSDSSKEEAIEFLDEMANASLEAFPGSKILEKEIRYIDNRKAAYFKMNQVYRVQDIQVEGISINYFTVHKGKLYQLNGFYPTVPTNEKETEPIINTSLATFVFEDWGDVNQKADIATVSGKSKTLGLFGEDLSGFDIFLAIASGIFFTWVLGLAIPLLLRFVFFKRPLSKWVSIAVAGFIWLLQALIETAISGKSTGHQALILVALVSYWILRKGASAIIGEK